MLGIDLAELVKTIGYIGIFAIIFAESGLLIGFFLPGDSLLFTAGFLASTNMPGTETPILNIWILIFGCAIAAITGDSVGYSFGRRVGRRLFQREDSVFFHKKHLVRAEEFYEKHGSKTIVIARFMPIVRTFAPIVAGMGQMHYSRFVTYNIVGGLLWSVGVTLAGYFLGNLIPDIDKYLLPIIALILIVSVAPTVIHVLRDPEMRGDIIKSVQKLFKRQPQAE
ncbi:MAG: VTT domain-containing protein [Anaerolineae bacterium]